MSVWAFGTCTSMRTCVCAHVHACNVWAVVTCACWSRHAHSMNMACAYFPVVASKCGGGVYVRHHPGEALHGPTGQASALTCSIPLSAAAPPRPC